MKYSVKTFCVIALLSASSAQAQKKELTLVWQTEANLKTPESVLWDKQNNALYFSNIEGDINQKDQKGSVGRMGPDGKNCVINWVSGLNAPKGLGIYKDKLYVADIDEVVVIDIKAIKIIQHIHVQGAMFLNDISVDAKGAVFVSDSRTGIVHKIMNDNVENFLDKQNGVNGLLCAGEDLYLLVNGVLWKSGKDKQLTKIAEGMESSTDGIEQTKNGDFIVSCWNGVIYYVTGKGTVTQLLDTREQKLNTADIGFDSDKNVVYVPTFFGNTVVTYQLK